MVNDARYGSATHPLPMTSRERQALQPLANGTPPSDDEARAFLQERLAFFGKIYASIGLGFYLLGNLAAASIGGGFSRRLSDPAFWIVPAASTAHAIQWAVCRRS